MRGMFDNVAESQEYLQTFTGLRFTILYLRSPTGCEIYYL